MYAYNGKQDSQIVRISNFNNTHMNRMYLVLYIRETIQLQCVQTKTVKTHQSFPWYCLLVNINWRDRISQKNKRQSFKTTLICECDKWNLFCTVSFVREKGGKVNKRVDFKILIGRYLILYSLPSDNILVDSFKHYPLFLDTMSIVDLTFDSSDDESNAMEKRAITPFSEAVYNSYLFYD